MSVKENTAVDEHKQQERRGPKQSRRGSGCSALRVAVNCECGIGTSRHYKHLSADGGRLTVPVWILSPEPLQQGDAICNNIL